LEEKKLEFERWNGKKVFIILNSNNRNNKNIVYSGVVKNVGNNFITITDKYNMEIMINTTEIKVIKEED